MPVVVPCDTSAAAPLPRCENRSCVTFSKGGPHRPPMRLMRPILSAAQMETIRPLSYWRAPFIGHVTNEKGRPFQTATCLR